MAQNINVQEFLKRILQFQIYPDYYQKVTNINREYYFLGHFQETVLRWLLFQLFQGSKK